MSAEENGGAAASDEQDAMAAEWAVHGIRVNSISPGIMNTRLSGGPSQMGLRRLWLERSPLVCAISRVLFCSVLSGRLFFRSEGGVWVCLFLRRGTRVAEF